MITTATIDELARRLAALVPASLRESAGAATQEAREDLSANFRDTLRQGLRKLDLVTRDEFDIQRGVLARTRDMIDALEQRIAELEATLGAPSAPH